MLTPAVKDQSHSYRLLGSFGIIDAREGRLQQHRLVIATVNRLDEENIAACGFSPVLVSAAGGGVVGVTGYAGSGFLGVSFLGGSGE